MAKRTGAFFGAIAERYDSIAQRGIPRYDEMLGALVDVTPARTDDVLELGCGTGALTVRLSERYPAAKLLAVDGAREMVALAQERLRQATIRRTTDLSFDRPDFNFKQFRSNMVLRWEYKPGSELFLVWTSARDESSSLGRFDLAGDFRSLLAAPASNVFIVKISHWLSL